jgi:hypothetical protein
MHFFCGNSKNTSYKSCWPCKDAHLHQKWDHGSIVCYGTCTNHGHLARSPRELLPSSNSLWRVLLWIIGIAMFGIFPRCYITHHDSMHSFSIFWILLNSISPPSRSRSNSWCLWCLPGGLGTHVWCWLSGPTPSGNLHIFSSYFLRCISCSPSSNMDLDLGQK